MAAWPGYYDYAYGYYCPSLDPSYQMNTTMSGFPKRVPYHEEIVDNFCETDSPPATVHHKESGQPSPVHHEDSQPSPVHHEDSQRYSYCLKFFRSKFVVEKLRRYNQFKSPTELRECLVAEFKHLVSSRNKFEVGYNSGQRGSAKIWIKDEEDLKNMYSLYSKPNDQEIVLWCEGVRSVADSTVTRGRKRNAVDNTDKAISKRQLIQDEVNDIFLSCKRNMVHNTHLLSTDCGQI